MDDLTIAEKWLAGMLAVGGAVVAWASGETKRNAAAAKLSARVDATEKDIRVLKDAHDRRLDDIQKDIHNLKTDMKGDIQQVWNRAEERHDQISNKLDRLIERIK